MKKYSEHTINERLESSLRVISERYKIELTWIEKLSLKQYLDYCTDLFNKKYLKENIEGAAIHLFMLDSFGLDSVVMGKLTESSYNLKKSEELSLYFEDWHEKTDQLQAHIRNNIQKWREERELI